MTRWHLITGEYTPALGGVGEYCRVVAAGLAEPLDRHTRGDDVHVWTTALPTPSTSRDSSTEAGPVQVHRELGRFRPGDLRRTDRAIESCPGPRRLLVQWVPHGFGWHAMNLPFCLWIRHRARRGDRVDLMIHEPYLGFGDAAPWQIPIAVAHRLMAAVLLRAATRVWTAIPAWERCLQPLTFGREVPFAWLPVPSTVTQPGPTARERVAAVRQRYLGARGRLVAHFGQVGAQTGSLVREIAEPLLRAVPEASLLLIGVGGEPFRDELVRTHRELRGRVHATGELHHQAVAEHLSACDLAVQPYPDGLSSRRTSAMASLSIGLPLVTTSGRLTEPLWVERSAAALVPVGDPGRFVSEAARLLRDVTSRRELGVRGRELYADRFALRHTIRALRMATLPSALRPAIARRRDEERQCA